MSILHDHDGRVQSRDETYRMSRPVPMSCTTEAARSSIALWLTTGADRQVISMVTATTTPSVWVWASICERGIVEVIQLPWQSKMRYVDRVESESAADVKGSVPIHVYLSEQC